MGFSTILVIALDVRMPLKFIFKGIKLLKKMMKGQEEFMCIIIVKLQVECGHIHVECEVCSHLGSLFALCWSVSSC